MFDRVRALASVGPSSEGGSRTVLQRVRWRFVLLHVVGTALVPFSLAQIEGSAIDKTVYLAAALALTGWVVWLYRTAARRQLLDVAGPALVATLGLAAGDAAWAFGALYLTLFVHSLYGHRARVFRNAAMYVLAYQLAVAAASGLSAVLTDQLVSTTLAVTVMAWVMHEMAVSLRRNDAAGEREAVLMEASRGLLRANEPDRVIEAALEGVTNLIADCGPDRRVSLWRRVGDQLQLAGLTGPPLTADQFDLAAMPVEPVAGYLQNQLVRVGPEVLTLARQAAGIVGGPDHGLAIPLTDGQGPLGLLFVETAEPLDDDVAAALHRFANEVSLAKRAARRNRLLAAVVDNSADGIMLVDDDLRVTFASNALTGLVGRQPVAGEPLGRLLETHSGERARPVIDLGEVERHGALLALRRADQTLVEVEVSTRRVTGEGTVLNIRDVSERRRMQAEITHRAFHDPLTGLANRALFLDRLGHALTRATRDRSRLAVALFDLDDFKAINDRWGHLAGDALLRHVAMQVGAHVRTSDTVARLGGDEYAVLLEGIDEQDDLQRWLSSALARVSEPMDLDGNRITVTASGGVAISDGPQSIEDMLGNADLAMYAAKDGGKNGAVLFHPDLRVIATERRQLHDELAVGIQTDQLELHYQPVLSLENGRTVGAEALVRWRHPTRGLLAPDQFIPLAEEGTLMVPLGRWVLTTACRELARWRGDDLVDDRFQVHVNLSMPELADEHLVDHVEATLDRFALSALQLVVEVTETALAADPGLVQQTLRRLHQLGISVAIDDFGTGYASFTYLQRFPVDIIKIDRSFVTDILQGPEQASLAHAIVRLANSLGLTTVAEGVEHEEPRQLLADWGCQHAQGWLWSPALPDEQFRDWLVSRPQPALTGPRD